MPLLFLAQLGLKVRLPSESYAGESNAMLRIQCYANFTLVYSFSKKQEFQCTQMTLSVVMSRDQHFSQPFTRALVFTLSRKCNNLTVHDKFIDGNEQRPTFTTFTTFHKGLVSNSLDQYRNYTLKGWETETKQLHATKNHQYHCERCENKEFV